MEAEAEEAASSLSSGLRNASAKVFADEHGEGTEMIHEDPPWKILRTPRTPPYWRVPQVALR